MKPITMKFNTVYYIREGIASIFTHGYMSFASVFVIVACLIIMGSFSLLAVNVSKVIGDFESENVMLAYVNETLSDEQARALVTQIKAVPNVTEALFITREDAMNAFVGKHSDQTRFENIFPSDFRHRYAVYVDEVALMSETFRAVANIPGIAKVNANLVVAQGFVTVRNIVSGVSITLVAALLTISLFIMSNTIKLATFERREEISIMRMVGATSGFIRWPFVFEGFILGFMGALVAFLVQWGLYRAVSEAVVNSKMSGFIAVVPFSRISLPLCALFVVIGLGVGAIGSGTAIRKYLKV